MFRPAAPFVSPPTAIPLTRSWTAPLCGDDPNLEHHLNWRG